MLYELQKHKTFTCAATVVNIVETHVRSIYEVILMASRILIIIMTAYYLLKSPFLPPVFSTR